MRLIEALRLSNPAARIAVVGAGGKTTAIFQLARQMQNALVTTTTHLGAWQSSLADQHFVIHKKEDALALRENLPPGVILFSGPSTPDQRLLGVDSSSLEALRGLGAAHQRPLLIEADGARQHPLKAPAAHEPAIPPCAEIVIVCAGLSALAQIPDESNSHRPAQIRALSGLAERQALNPQNLQALLLHPAGGLKNIPPAARRICLLTQAETEARQSAANQIAQDLQTAYDAIWIADLAKETLHACIEPCAAIILAGGAAERYGQPKQLLDWNGQPLIRHVTAGALAAQIGPVIVVTGAQAEGVEAALHGLPIHIARAEHWWQGQSASIRAGLDALDHLARPPGSVIFVLADQPYVTASLLQALAERHSQNLAAIIAPLTDGRRANPVLFDRATWGDLSQLQGDLGGRAIFSKYRLDYLPWLDGRIQLDIDSPDDYRQALLGR